MMLMMGQQSADPTKTDVSSIARAHLTSLRNDIRTAAVVIPDNLSRYHLTDLVERINKALDPK
jgi:hypothetical protein